jgi:hypothetical protein
MKNQKLWQVASTVVPALTFLGILSFGCQSSRAQTSGSTTEIEKLRLVVDRQQEMLDQQQSEIQALQAALAEQKKMVLSVVRAATSREALNPTIGTSPDNNEQAQTEMLQDPIAQQPVTPEQVQVEEELQRGPEIADVTPTTPALELGPAKIRLIGYPALTSVWRSNNNGGNVATNFNNIPFDNTVPGTTSEFRLSPQNTRLALRVDTDLKSSQVAGYFEMDFVGAPVGGNLVTQSGYPFRIRQAWLDWRKGKWEMTAGQLWSLMTPNKEGILPWPGDIAAPQVIDLNFVAGFVVGRFPQFRLVYRPTGKVAFGFSVENPEQEVSNSVVFPSALSNTLATQYNTGTSGLNVPNMTPDFVLKGSFDDKIAGGRRIHFDVGTVVRSFRSWDGTTAAGKDYAFGWGVGANFNLELNRGVRWVLDGFDSAGGGRYIGGLAPDVIVRANGSISPIHSYSWVSGFEFAPSKTTGLYFYYSGLYAQKNVALNSDGTCCVGFGFPGASTAADRLIEEATAGYSRVLWKYESLGSVQWGLQYAYVWLHPWVSGGGPGSANSSILFSQIRYNLP